MTWHNLMGAKTCNRPCPYLHDRREAALEGAIKRKIAWEEERKRRVADQIERKKIEEAKALEAAEEEARRARAVVKRKALAISLKERHRCTPCIYYQRGRCRYADRCFYGHFMVPKSESDGMDEADDDDDDDTTEHKTTATRIFVDGDVADDANDDGKRRAIHPRDLRVTVDTGVRMADVVAASHPHVPVWPDDVKLAARKKLEAEKAEERRIALVEAEKTAMVMRARAKYTRDNIPPHELCCDIVGCPRRVLYYDSGKCNTCLHHQEMMQKMLLA
jgi:hypothetical protein